MNTNSNPRSFLLLQGVASPFFHELENELLRLDIPCLKVNFCGGDIFSGSFFRKSQSAINYRGTLEALPEFYQQLFTDNNVTDIVLFGDTRPVHIDAISLAKKSNINTHVFEEGYFRPNWITLDKGGVNAYSHIYQQSKNDPEWFLENGSDLQWADTSESTGGNLLIRAWHDIRYHIAKWAFTKQFPYYKTHRPDSPLAEYWGFIRRIPYVYFYQFKRENRRIDALIDSHKPFYVLPLQLNADSQIKIHSSFDGLHDFIDTCLESFSKHAPVTSTLVIKLHPLDPWFVDYEKHIKQRLRHFNIDASRMLYVEAGDLTTLLQHAKGTVLVNSTVGTSALAVNCPVIALGSAIYDIEGLSFQGGLDEFWQASYSQKCSPNKELFAAFRQCYIKHSQVNGSFYNRKGIEMAVSECARKLLSNS